MYVDTKFNFQKHLNNVLLNKKTLGLLRKLQVFLTRQSLVTVFKAFIRPHLEYGDIIYNKSFYQKMESIQYNAALATTDAIRDTLEKNFIKS